MKREHKHPTPPKAAPRLLSLFCPAHLHEEIEEDLIQKFNKDLQLSEVSDTFKVSDTYRLRRAKRRLIWNVICSFDRG